MSTSAAIHSQRVISKIEDILSPVEINIFADLVVRYRNRSVGTEGLSENTAYQAVETVKRITRYFQKAIWNITYADVDKWFGHLAFDLKLAKSTRRAYQAQLKSFCAFMLQQHDLIEQIRGLTGTKPRQIISDEARILHKTEYDGKKSRRSISRHHLKLLFDTLDRDITAAYLAGSKKYWTLCRDKALIYLIYGTGMRRDEAAKLSLGSFTDNPSEPRLGRFALWYVHGKGDKDRPVQSLLPSLSNIMEWYLEEVRPKLLNGRPDPKALFLTEGGKAISDEVVYQAFCRMLKAADLTGLGYTLHCLRHTYTTSAVPLIGAVATQEQVGHVYLSTTMGYHHPPAKTKGREIANAVNRIFDQRNK